MKFLSRPEELILYAIWHLGDLAYCVPIRKEVSDISGTDWSFGAVYVPLARLEKKGFIRSRLGKPTQKRGGRSKRYYVLTKLGLQALADVRQLHEGMWVGMPRILGDKGPS